MTDAPAWVRLRYTPPAGTATPIFALERSWYAGSERVIPAIDLSTIDGIPGFTVLGPAESPLPAPRRG